MNCPNCHFGELCLTPARWHLHCAVCGFTMSVPKDDDYDA